MTPQAFWQLCKDHDWYYQYSDDHRYWQAGRDESDRLQKLLSIDPTLRPIYNEWTTWIKDQDPATMPKMPT